MKKENMTFKRLAFLLMVWIPLMGVSQQFSKEKALERHYGVSAATTLDIENKYGNIQMLTWDRDSIRVRMRVIAKSNKNDQLDNILENIDFNFTRTNYFIGIETEFQKSYDSFFHDLLNLAESFVSDEDEVEINYTIQAPEYINVHITNKFGDIYMDDLVGDVIIKLSNGDLKANNLGGNAELHITMGDGDIHAITAGKLFLNYAEVHLQETDKITIDSKISTIHIDKGNVVKLISKKDKFYIKETRQLFGESYFSDLNITNLSNKANVEMRYGNMNLDRIRKEFSFIDLASEYTDITMCFERGSSFYLDITHEGSGVRLPDAFGELTKKTLNEAENQYATYGEVGNEKTDAKVKIRATKGSVKLHYK